MPPTTSDRTTSRPGFGYQRVDADVLRDQSGGQLVNVLGTTDEGQTIYSHTFFASPEATIENPTLAPVVATPRNNVFAVYVQDRWEILHNLTVNAGVRWEKQEIQGLGDITYINVDHFSPRVGVTWDFLNNGRSKAYASYSEFVPLIPMDMNVRSLNGERDGYTQNFSPTDLACDTGGVPGRLHHPRQARRRHRPEPEVALFEGDPGRRRAAARDQLGASASRGSTGRSGACSRTPAFRWTSATTTPSSTPGRAP